VTNIEDTMNQTRPQHLIDAARRIADELDHIAELPAEKIVRIMDDRLTHSDLTEGPSEISPESWAENWQRGQNLTPPSAQELRAAAAWFCSIAEIAALTTTEGIDEDLLEGAVLGGRYGSIASLLAETAFVDAPVRLVYRRFGEAETVRQSGRYPLTAAEAWIIAWHDWLAQDTHRYAVALSDLRALAEQEN
jgi:hypothetical protein